VKKEHSIRYETDEQGSINQNYHVAKFLNFAIQTLKGLLEVASKKNQKIKAVGPLLVFYGVSISVDAKPGALGILDSDLIQWFIQSCLAYWCDPFCSLSYTVFHRSFFWKSSVFYRFQVSDAYSSKNYGDSLRPGRREVGVIEFLVPV